MKHPIQFIMLGVGGCIVTAATLFITGIFSENHSLKTAGAWFALTAFVIGVLPLLSVLALLLIEKFPRK